MSREHLVGERVRVEGDRCVYCGERATCWDHFPPYACDALRGWLLPACGECNGLAGDRHPYDFERRAAFVNRALISRYQWALDSVPWSPAELGELGRGLRDAVEPLAHARSIARDRVRWSAVAYLATLGRGRRFQPVAIPPPWRTPRVFEPWKAPRLIEHAPGRKRWRGCHWVERSPWRGCNAVERLQLGWWRDRTRSAVESRERALAEIEAATKTREDAKALAAADRLTRAEIETLRHLVFDAIFRVIIRALPE
jgi:hypothetical protein